TEAIMTCQKSLTLDPHLTAAHHELALDYVAAGQLGPARREFEAYLALAPHAADASQVRQVLKNLRVNR
ncbi:MAG: tetratricopeptide repeat protein, partial [Acidobacteriota bacterium]|nr:tetratricopeptide repeat protein [Acidobacteriota bacterium]